MSGCFAKKTYSDYFQGLYNQVVLRGDQDALNEIIQATESRSYWIRYYGYIFLGNLVAEYPSDKDLKSREELLDILAMGLEDTEQEIQRAVVTRLKKAGSEGVRRGFDKFVLFVSECRETDVAWFSAEALSITVSKEHTKLAIETLTEALKCRPTPVRSGSSGPQLRRFALRALADLVRQGEVQAEDLLSNLRGEVPDDAFMREIEETLTPKR